MPRSALDLDPDAARPSPAPAPVPAPRARRVDAPAPVAAGSLSFAHMAGALQQGPAPARPAPRAKPMPGPGPVAAPPDAQVALAEAESLMRAGAGEQALARCESAWPQVVASGDAGLAGALWHLRAICHEHAGRLKEAMEAGYQAIVALERAQATPRLVRMLTLQALIVGQLGDAGGAVGLLARASGLLPGLGDRPLETCIYWFNAGATFEVLDDLGRAVDAGAQACRLSQALPEADPVRALARGHLLGYEMAREEVAAPGSDAHLAAIARFRAHLVQDFEAGRFDVVPFRAEACARSLIRAGRLDAARDVLRTGVDAVVASGHPLKRGALEMRCAEVERLQGRHKAAASHIALALALIAQGEDMRELEAAHLENSRLHEAQQRWRAALDSFKRHAEIREALHRARSDMRVQAVLARVAAERAGPAVRA